MSLLKPSDRLFHYPDGSHRWLPPNEDQDDEVWRKLVKAHIQAHQAAPNAGYMPGTLPKRNQRT
jgi:hypothetical protein